MFCFLAPCMVDRGAGHVEAAEDDGQLKLRLVLLGLAVPGGEVR